MSRPRQIDLEKITAAALAIADKEGFEAVSMRRVADELGAGTMSLYYHVKTKADLISAMDDALMAKIILDRVPDDWRGALTAIALRTRDVLVRHPWAIVSMQSAPPGVNAMRHMEQCLQALAQTGMMTDEKLTLLALVDDFVFGYALRETAAEPVVDAEAAKKRLASGAFPELAKAFRKERKCCFPDRFQRGLAALLEAGSLENSKRNTQRPTPRRPSV